MCYICRWFSTEYESFYLDSAGGFYALHVSGSYTGDAGDVIQGNPNPLSQHICCSPPTDQCGDYNDDDGDDVMMMFSAKDLDSDLGPGNCAQIFSSGWWYNGCNFVDLNGPNWDYFGLSQYGLAPTADVMGSRMMIKRSD